MKQTSKKQYWILNITIPILVGFSIYLLWTSDTYVSSMVRALLRHFGLPEIPLLRLSGPAARFARNHLCDMCWSYALVFSIALIQGFTGKDVICTVWICSGFSAAMEIAQYLHIVSGTFDILDIVLEIIACIFAGMMIYLFDWRKKT